MDLHGSDEAEVQQWHDSQEYEFRPPRSPLPGTVFHFPKRQWDRSYQAAARNRCFASEGPMLTGY